MKMKPLFIVLAAFGVLGMIVSLFQGGQNFVVCLAWTAIFASPYWWPLLKLKLFGAGSKDNHSAAHSAQHVARDPEPDTWDDESAEERRERSSYARNVYVPASHVGEARCSSWKDSRTATSYVVLDTETTGLNPKTDRIIEFAAIRCVNDVPVDGYRTFVNPERPLPDKIVKLTGITQADVDGAPLFSEVAQKILDFVGDDLVIGHNVTFDTGFLIQSFARTGRKVDLTYIDTLSLARQAYPDMVNHKLATLIQELDLLPHEQQHRAGSDVIATQRLFVQCKERFANVAELERQKLVRDAKRAAPEDRGYKFELAAGEYERAGLIDTAIAYYEQSIAEAYTAPYSYKRLAILYRKAKNYVDEIRVCNAALQKCRDPEALADFQHRLDVATAKLAKSQQ